MFLPVTSGLFSFGESLVSRRRFNTTASVTGPNRHLGPTSSSPTAPTHAAHQLIHIPLTIPLAIKSDFKRQTIKGRRRTHQPALQAELQDAPCEATEASIRLPGSGIQLDSAGEASMHSVHDMRMEAMHTDNAIDRQQRGEVIRSSQPSSRGTGGPEDFSYAPSERSQIRETWATLMRWSKRMRQQEQSNPIDSTKKVVVFGGGSFGTAIASCLAKKKKDMEVVLLLRDQGLCNDINISHCNTRYLPEFKLPDNVRATTVASEAILGAQFAVHAVPCQSSRAFLRSIKDILPANVPIISVSKGLETGTGLMMSELIPSALERKQPCVFISGPSFAREVMEGRPTAVVAACKDHEINRTVQELFANQTMRVNTTGDVVGVEICGALKNVLAIAAGIVEGLGLGNNALAALIAQGCSEIRWLSEKMGAQPTTMSGLSGLGDIMLTCYGNLSRNRSVGIRLGKGEKLADIVASSKQVAEGVATAGVVILLAKRYRVALPVLTAVAQVLDNALTPREAVYAVMNLPQIEES